jgi:hypothetical protein
MAYALQDPFIGTQPLPLLDTVGPGPANQAGGVLGGFNSFYNDETRGYDTALGAGVFIYARYSGTITVGTICELTPTISGGNVITSATAWAGTAITGRPLAVAMATTGAVGQWGWFQVQGNAVCTVSGAPAAGNPVYWQAAGVVSPTPVASKQMVNAQFQTAVSQTIGQGSTAVVLSATQAVVFLNRPFAQGTIT